MKLDWSEVRPKRKPTKKQVSLYRRWRKYLSDSRLDEETQHQRAAAYAEQGNKVPDFD